MKIIVFISCYYVILMTSKTGEYKMTLLNKMIQSLNKMARCEFCQKPIHDAEEYNNLCHSCAEEFYS